MGDLRIGRMANLRSKAADQEDLVVDLPVIGANSPNGGLCDSRSPRRPARQARWLRLAPQPARLPVVIFSPLGGALTDRFSRRAMMVISDAITAACMAIGEQYCKCYFKYSSNTHAVDLLSAM